MSPFGFTLKRMLVVSFQQDFSVYFLQPSVITSHPGRCRGATTQHDAATTRLHGGDVVLFFFFFFVKFH